MAPQFQDQMVPGNQARFSLSIRMANLAPGFNQGQDSAGSFLCYAPRDIGRNIRRDGC